MNPLTRSIALALGAISVQPVMAQDQEAGMTEEVVVTGVRRSLIDSAAIKRDSDGVVMPFPRKISVSSRILILLRHYKE